ncbi:MAG: hypothetical protein KDI30_08735, partial [Pseudomonadales bacterium]|nr:hypothetical protein [Pseudomonadales bacterium]
SQGWTHAKLSGHQNERLLYDQIQDCTSINQLRPGMAISNTEIGGLNEKNVPCIIGCTTKSKTDLAITWSDNLPTNISIKKSLAGQAYLIKTSRFIAGYEAHYNTSISTEVKEGLLLFFGEHSKTRDILAQYPSDNEQEQNYQKRKSRLTWNTLSKYKNSVANEMLSWISGNIGNIADFCFSKGLAKNSDAWADYLWCKNRLGEHEVDELFCIKDISQLCSEKSNLVIIGNRGGGTTIRLPFGFVQWHQGQMQFHHCYNDIRGLFI